MTNEDTPVNEQVTDEELEYVERLLFDELHKLHQKKEKGYDVASEIILIEQSLESITIIRDALTSTKETEIRLTAEEVEKALANRRPEGA
jgi:hypothetical protein